MWIFLTIFISLFLLLAIIGFILFIVACRRADKQSDVFSPWSQNWGEWSGIIAKGQEWVKDNTTEKLELTSDDGLKLMGILMPAENAKGTVIAFHGYHSRAIVDFSPHAEFFHNCGYNVVLPCQRSHDESEGKYITFGAKERFDCKRWAELVANRFDGDIFLAGISMGCATVTMASGLKLPERVRGVIADCGFTSPYEIMLHVAKTFPVVKYITPLIMPFSSFFCRTIAKFDPKEASSIEAMKTNKLPFLFIHGGKDKFVPTEMTYRIYEACTTEKRLFIVEQAAHAQSYLLDKENYDLAMKDFFAEYGNK